MDASRIVIGTSGYSFKDWVGPFYPPSTASGQMIEHYARHFNAAEINSTYYRIPHPRVFEHLAHKTPPEFEFIVKVHQETTHQRQENEPACRNLQIAVQPLKDATKFQGWLAQFPYSFKNNAHNRKYLAETRHLLPDDPFFVEFRHNSWLEPEIYDFLRGLGIGYVNVDQPRLPKLLPPQSISTSDTGYVRFHGRNTANWWDSSRGDRYDYKYRKPELSEWKDRLLELLQDVKKLYLFFNNCHHGHAVENALEMQDLVEGL
jgi:uncharacterized protein YecE (DUF72 family)